jgi:hypothetical protein
MTVFSLPNILTNLLPHELTFDSIYVGEKRKNPKSLREVEKKGAPPVRQSADSSFQRGLGVVVIVSHIPGRVFHAAPGVLQLAFGLVGAAFVLELLVAEEGAGTLFKFAAGLLHAALGAIGVNSGSGITVVHDGSPSVSYI